MRNSENNTLTRFVLVIALFVLPFQVWAKSQDDEQQAMCKGFKVPANINPPEFKAKMTKDELKKCSSSDFYYGVKTNVNFDKALECAYHERAQNDERVANPLGGSAMLSMLYANGQGVERNLDLASRFVCESSWASVMEIKYRLEFLKNQSKSGATKENFELCDLITSGMSMGVCKGVKVRLAEMARDTQYASMLKTWNAEQKAASQKLKQSADKFAEAKAGLEQDQTGTARGMFYHDEVDRQNQQVLINLKDFIANRAPRATSAAREKSQNEMRELLHQLSLLYPKQSEIPLDEVSRENIQKTQVAWNNMFQDWLAFAQSGVFKNSEDDIANRLMRQRIFQLKKLVEYAPKS